MRLCLIYKFLPSQDQWKHLHCDWLCPFYKLVQAKTEAIVEKYFSHIEDVEGNQYMLSYFLQFCVIPVWSMKLDHKAASLSLVHFTVALLPLFNSLNWSASFLPQDLYTCHSHCDAFYFTLCMFLCFRSSQNNISS